MEKRLGFLIDLGRCVGCRGCEIACINENRLQQVQYRRVTKIGNETSLTGFLSLSCNHCVNPECIRVCKSKCFQKRRDGVVLQNPQRCDGCRSCVGACPFQIPKLNPRTKKAGKCNFCADRVRQGLEPACVSACVVSALRVIDLNQPEPDWRETLSMFPIVQFTQPSLRFIPPRSPLCSWRIS